MTINKSNHPVAQHFLSVTRNRETQPQQFRQAIATLSSILAIDATASLATSQSTAHSPVAQFTSVSISDTVALFPIMRAGISMVDPFLNTVPSAKVHHLGIYRESTTLLPVEYYNKLPSTCSIDIGFVLDPMVATAGTSIAAINILKDWGLKKIKFISIIASESGIEALAAAHPDVDIHIIAIDPSLNDHGYIVPGLGDAGDRLFNTLKE